MPYTPTLASTAITAVLLAVTTGCVPAHHVTRISEPAECARRCLEGFVDRYLDALAARDPSRLPWARNAKYTENNVALAIGDGLWGTANGVGSAEQGMKVTDPARGQVAYIGVLQERGDPVYIALRLKVVAGQVSESEIIVNRRGGPGPRGNPLALRHDAVFLRDVAATGRTPPDDMTRLSAGYFDTMQLNDGRLFTVFDDGCSRIENGFKTSGDRESSDALTRLGCAEQFKLGYFRFDDRVRERDFMLVDVERSVVLARGFIDHSGRLEKYALTDGTVREPRGKAPQTWHFLEAFKIESGRIRSIESVFIDVPYGMPSPWTR